MYNWYFLQLKFANQKKVGGVSMWGDGYVNLMAGGSFHYVYIYQVITLYILNISQFCQLDLSKAEKKYLSKDNVSILCNILIHASFL